jgi:hypothetical protein
MCGAKPTSASLQQTLPASRLPPSPSPVLLVIVRLILLTSCWILIGAHGRARSRKAQVSEGMAVLSEAPSLSIQLLRGFKNSMRKKLYQFRGGRGDILIAIDSRQSGPRWSAKLAQFFAAADITPKQICDSTKNTEVLVCLSAGSREEVDEIVRKAVAAGGTTYNEPQDHGFMYGHGFQDPDGHIWELAFMEPTAMKAEA